MAMWVALCDDGRHWSVFIAPNGDTQVRDCEHMRAAGPAPVPPGRRPPAPAPPATKG